MAYSNRVDNFVNSWQPQTYAYSSAGDPVVNMANQQINQAANRESQRRDIEWANRQRMYDPSYWSQAFGIGGSGAAPTNYYETRLKSLMDNPDAIANSGVYKFAFNQGNEAVNRNLAAKGLLKSGNRLAELTKFGQGLASQQYGQEADRLGQLASSRYAVDTQGQNQLKSIMMNAMMQQMNRTGPVVTDQTPGGMLTRW